MKSLFPALLAALLLLSGCTGETAVSPSPSPSAPVSAPQPSAVPPGSSEAPEEPAWWEGISPGDLPDGFTQQLSMPAPFAPAMSDSRESPIIRHLSFVVCRSDKIRAKKADRGLMTPMSSEIYTR